jgi:hypothetical protein
VVKRTNYKQEKRIKELEKQKKKDAKKERKLNKDKSTSVEEGFIHEESNGEENHQEINQEENLS